MNEFRVFLSVISFSISIYLLVDLFNVGFDIFVLAGSLVGFVITHYLWPIYQAKNNEWLDILEFIIDFPYKCISLAFRSFGGSSKNSGGDFDGDF